MRMWVGLSTLSPELHCKLLGAGGERSRGRLANGFGFGGVIIALFCFCQPRIICCIAMRERERKADTLLTSVNDSQRQLHSALWNIITETEPINNQRVGGNVTINLTQTAVNIYTNTLKRLSLSHLHDLLKLCKRKIL